MDIVGTLTVTTQGHKHKLTFQDYLNIAVPISQQDAETIARVLFKKLYSNLAFPKLF
jgi:hypothetical protein